jgi:hypothetical protein
MQVEVLLKRAACCIWTLTKLSYGDILCRDAIGFLSRTAESTSQGIQAGGGPMAVRYPEIALLDFVDLEAIQELQGAVSAATGVLMAVLDAKGRAVTKYSRPYVVVSVSANNYITNLGRRNGKE